MPKSDMPGEQTLADAAVPDQPAAVRQAGVHRWTTSTRTRSSRDAGARGVQAAARRRRATRGCSRRSTSSTRCTFRAATAARSSATPRRSRPAGNVYVIGQDNPGVLQLLVKNAAGRRSSRAGGVPARVPGLPRPGSQPAPERADAADVPGRLDAATIRATITNGKGRMPAFPHLTDVEMETLVTYIVAPPGGACGRGRGAGPRPSRPDRSSASGGAQVRPARRRPRPRRRSAALPGRRRADAAVRHRRLRHHRHHDEAAVHHADANTT